MQSLQLHKGKLIERVVVPSSKSYANRALILASLQKNSPELRQLPKASDVTTLLECLSVIGMKIQQSENSVQFLNSFPECELSDPPSIHVGEGGTTARFLAGMLLLGKSRYSLILGDRLKERPWDEFIQFAGKFGAKVSLSDDTLSIQGPIKLPTKIDIDCSKTTQFASAIQLLSMKTGVKVNPVNMNSSQSYWEMTEKMVTDFPKLKSYVIPRDWSSASYPMAFAALNHKIVFPGLLPDPYQADSKLISLLRGFDCLDIQPDGMTVKPIEKHHAVTMDVSDCLDLVPTLVYLLSHVEGKHELKGIENLIHKESDRLAEVIKLAQLYDRKISTDGEKIFLVGKSSRIDKAMDIRMPDDHRMVMTGALFLLHHGGGRIGPKGAVSKSYPEFFDLISY